MVGGSLMANPAWSPTLARAARKAVDYIRKAKSEATQRAYAADWADFSGWCARHALVALPADPATVVLYLTDLAERVKASTLQRRVTALGQAHEAAGHPSPTGVSVVRECLKGIRRTIGTAQDKATPVLVEDLQAMVNALDLGSPLGLRDRALLCLGFAAALRRSELVGLDVADLEWREQGLVLNLRRSKTDQEAAGRRVAVVKARNGLCAVNALKVWLEAAEITEGPVFRAVNKGGKVGSDRLSDRAVDLVVRRLAQAVDLIGNFSAHSLRAGLATSAARAGLSERDIAKQTGHQNMTVLRGYIREGDLFRNNVTGNLEL